MTAMQQEYDSRLANRLSDSMREVVVVLLREKYRPTPNAIECIRDCVARAMRDAGRLALEHQSQRPRPPVKQSLQPGPWDDEPTAPGRPSRIPRR